MIPNRTTLSGRNLFVFIAPEISGSRIKRDYMEFGLISIN